jgi:hypothetical protein
MTGFSLIVVSWATPSERVCPVLLSYARRSAQGATRTADDDDADSGGNRLSTPGRWHLCFRANQPQQCEGRGRRRAENAIGAGGQSMGRAGEAASTQPASGTLMQQRENGMSPHGASGSNGYRKIEAVRSERTKSPRAKRACVTNSSEPGCVF